MKLETRSSVNHTSLFIKFKIPFIPKSFQLSTVYYNEPSVWVHGYSSRTTNGRYILFHDYDNLDFRAVCDELSWLQQRFRLSSYYVFRLDREDSFHAVCLDTMSISSLYNIQKATSCDLAFVNSIKRLQTKEWVLRWDEKGKRNAPQFLKVIPSKFNVRKKSSAHANFLKKMGITVLSKGPWDGLKEMALIDYNTANRTQKKGDA